ncbi:MAG: hypothetical protein GTN89_12470 [Acidobacteria bacterium]|nr:hypothetical protein [Acidobacteriota bacterium]NIM63427.1 hypothetical protein [Acidobacteriota bacterium]NIO58358.1 hypothetical protein [Acidobacteriota bacterium]NIQ31157.1 hypothetical protein [Acidobacteriota bacterium]NIQ84029.1 hypothetical protein [Acidobacteriota bacterium]
MTVAITLLLLASQLSAYERAPSFHESNAVLLNVSETDLNRIVRDAFREHLGTKIEGASSDPSRGIRELRYEATFSEPVLELAPGGTARVDLDLLQADLRIGRFEKKFMRKMASCDNAGLNVDPDDPVEMALYLSFEVTDHDLQIVPSDLTIERSKDFNLIKPTKCRNTWLPKWLVWRIGKGELRRKIKRLDDLLLAKARASASDLGDDDGLLALRWRNLFLYPERVDTSHRSLLVGFAGATERQPSTGDLPGWVAEESRHSYIGVSESFLNSVARSAMQRLQSGPRRPGGNLSKLFRGDAIHSLIPGLRDLRPDADLRLGWTFHRAPVIELDALAADRALVRVRLSGAELTIWDGAERLGALEIDSARLGVLPYLNVLGGISFEVVENTWLLSARDIDFDVETLAATFQELFFGEMFETRYQPVAERAFDVGETAFRPRYFRLLDRYLVIGLAE